ncbi:MAG: sulfatase [bacterium]
MTSLVGRAALLAATLAIAGPATGVSATGRGGEPAPNLVLVVADDWSWPHAGVYGEPGIRTPAFDRLARRGALYREAFAPSPVDSPSRAAILTGRAPHSLGDAANDESRFPDSVATYPDLLAAAGWFVGSDGEGWSAAPLDPSEQDPVGPSWGSFEAFLSARPASKPFAFWHGSGHPRRPYPEGAGRAAGKRRDDAPSPRELPDLPEVREDLLGYVAAVEAFDREVAGILRSLDERALGPRTLIVVTSDNGMPFPRAKADVYDAGTHVPLVIRDPEAFLRGRVLPDLVELTDLAPTFLEAAGIAVPPGTNGRSLRDALRERPYVPATAAFLERERRLDARKGGLGYPVRAVRTKDFLYVRNLRPGRWPLGDPPAGADAGSGFADVDPSPTKSVLLARRDDAKVARFYRRAFLRRPLEELYDLTSDPSQLVDVAALPKYEKALAGLRGKLATWMAETHDPRAGEQPEQWPEGDGPVDAWDLAPTRAGQPDPGGKRSP